MENFNKFYNEYEKKELIKSDKDAISSYSLTNLNVSLICNNLYYCMFLFYQFFLEHNLDENQIFYFLSLIKFTKNNGNLKINYKLLDDYILKTLNDKKIVTYYSIKEIFKIRIINWRNNPIYSDTICIEKKEIKHLIDLDTKQNEIFLGKIITLKNIGNLKCIGEIYSGNKLKGIICELVNNYKKSLLIEAVKWIDNNNLIKIKIIQFKNIFSHDLEKINLFKNQLIIYVDESIQRNTNPVIKIRNKYFSKKIKNQKLVLYQFYPIINC